VAPEGDRGRLAVFGAAPRPYRVDGPPAELAGRAGAAARPAGDLHGGAGYRRHLVGVVARRALAALGAGSA
jgi:CO/xanthine dehydrogenase FAD-binding subunit